jgi:hypothetical protein
VPSGLSFDVIFDHLNELESRNIHVSAIGSIWQKSPILMIPWRFGSMALRTGGHFSSDAIHNSL